MRVKVWNDNELIDWTEMFRGDKVTIPRGGHIEMEFNDASDLKSQFSPIKLKPDGTIDPLCFKKLRLEKIIDTESASDEDEGQEVFQCQLCKKIYTTEASLIKHSSAEHSDRMVVDHDAERAAPKKRGRPAKEKTEEQTT